MSRLIDIEKGVKEKRVGLYIVLTQSEKNKIVKLSRKYNMTVTDLIKQQVFLLKLTGGKKSNG